MAKIAIKYENIVPHGVIFYVMDEFVVSVESTINCHTSWIGAFLFSPIKVLGSKNDDLF